MFSEVTSKINEKSNEIVEFISDLSECPVCIEAIKSAPIHQCTNGHVICKNCILKLDNCPICRSDSKIARNLMLEQIIVKIYGPQQVKEGTYEKSKLEEWGHGSERVHFSNDGPNEELNLTSNFGPSVDLEIMEAGTQHVDRCSSVKKSIKKILKFIGIAILFCLLTVGLYILIIQIINYISHII